MNGSCRLVHPQGTYCATNNALKSRPYGTGDIVLVYEEKVQIFGSETLRSPKKISPEILEHYLGLLHCYHHRGARRLDPPPAGAGGPINFPRDVPMDADFMVMTLIDAARKFPRAIVSRNLSAHVYPLSALLHIKSGTKFLPYLFSSISCLSTE